MRFGGIVLAAVLSLGACSSDPAPKEPKPTPTTSAPTATPPTMPPQAKKDSPEGAANFVRHYIDLVNFAASTGDVRPMNTASRDCKPCESYASEFMKTPADGERFGGIFWTLKGASVSSTRSPLEVNAEVTALEGRKSQAYTFAFVLTSAAPFAVRDIYIVEAE